MPPSQPVCGAPADAAVYRTCMASCEGVGLENSGVDVVRRLGRARLYLCTDARGSAGELRDFVRRVFAGGVDVVQVRDRSISTADEVEALRIVRQEARAAGALCAANDRADVGLVAGVDVVHVGQEDLSPVQVKSVCPGALVGVSTHSREQFVTAMAAPEVDYFCVGPVWATPTKPGRAAVGLGLVAEAARVGSGKPWFAIGGVDVSSVKRVVDAGAERVVVVRALTQADDPEGAARALRACLPG